MLDDDSTRPSPTGDVWSFAMTVLVSLDHLYREIN